MMIIKKVVSLALAVLMQVGTALAQSESAPPTTYDHTIVPVEKDAMIHKYSKGDISDILNFFVATVHNNDYRCDSITAAHPYFFGNNGVVLRCNNGRYTYDIEDKGGHWVVTVE
jgi:hypothetical protein